MLHVLQMPRPDRPTVEGSTLQVEVFPDGETSIRVPDRHRNLDVVLFGECSTVQASEAFLAAAYELASRGFRSLTIFNTYFRHARSERRVEDKVAMAKFQARQWSGVGRVFPGVRLVFVELHKDLILNFFEGAVVTENRSFIPQLERIVRNDFPNLVNPVYATVDEGGVYAARQLATARGAGFAYIEKHRISGSETHVHRVLGDSVVDRDVVIFDDIISTGSSMVKAAAAYSKLGARNVYAAATHGVFVEDAINKLAGSPIRCVFVSDSHPNAELAAAQQAGFLRVFPLNLQDNI